MQAVLIPLVALAVLQGQFPCEPSVPAAPQTCPTEASDIGPRFPPVEVELGLAPGITRGQAAEILEIRSVWVSLTDDTTTARAQLESLKQTLGSRLQSTFPNLRVNAHQASPDGMIFMSIEPSSNKVTPRAVDVFAMVYRYQPDALYSARLVFTFRMTCHSSEESIESFVNALKTAARQPAVSP